MDFHTLVQECAPFVSVKTMAAIVRPESSFNPFAIGINGGARLVRQPQNKAEAVATAKWLVERGYNIDMGATQVNIKNARRFNLTIEDAFDPCKNMAVGGSILYWNYQSARKVHKDEQVALRAAISMYNTGSFQRGFSNGYVQRVVSASTKPIPSMHIAGTEHIPARTPQ